MYDVVLYEDARGNSPIQTFLDELNEKAETDKSSRILLNQFYYCVELLKQNGTRTGKKFTKPITDQIWEVRPGKHRVFFFMWNGNHIVLLHEFRKETRKAPKLEIEQAEREMNDWIKRHGQ